jgi:RNA polymerase sporulation-specific sigma factor
MEAARPALSFYAKDENSGFSPENLASQEDMIEDTVGKIALREAVETLPEWEKKLILLRYFKNLTQSQTARFLGVSQVKISREEKKILEKLREQFQAS